MANEEVSRRIEDIEGKLEELEDLALTNKIEILEIKSILKNIQTGQPAAAPGAVLGPQGPVPLPKDVVKAVENLFKITNSIQRRLDALTADLEVLKRTQKKPFFGRKEEAPVAKPLPFMPVPAGPPGAQPVVGELHITEIRSKLDEAKRLMGV